MARVCAELRVPRPSRGHWSKLEFGKTSPKGSLPDARPGDLTVWRRDSYLPATQPLVVRPPVRLAPVSKPRAAKPAPDARHELVTGVRGHFAKTRSSEVGLLRPFKRILVDIVVSETRLDYALDAANVLFQALTARGHRVVLAPSDVSMRRATVEEREVPEKNRYRQPTWSPDRATVVYVDGVPIGLTLFETTEELEVVYDHGNYVQVRTLTSRQQKLLTDPSHWTTKKSYPSARLCLQAYCPHRGVDWTQQWRESETGQLVHLVKDIVQQLEAMSPKLVKLVEEATLQEEARRKKWEEDRQRMREEAEKARLVKARAEAKQDILNAIKGWDEARRIHAYFDAAEQDANRLGDEARSLVLERLNQARELIGPVDALEVLRSWKSPEQR